MNKEEEKKNQPLDQEKQQTSATGSSSEKNTDDDQHSYPGKLDQVEGSMNNGEIGGSITKEDA